ncbi:MAG: ABC transporter ATP-binding protein [Lachnospiraceae bacterium]|nr:ABC transporter ATP-binding protein [Lachnospiraceae bacterium]
MVMAEQKKLVETEHLKTYFPIKRKILDYVARKPQKYVKAVDDISIEVYENEILGLVGESGCGKSTLARTILRLNDPTDGKIEFNGTDITHMSNKELKPMRRNMQMVFQDPYSSLDPRVTIGDMLKTELLYHNLCKPEQVHQRILDILTEVGMDEEATKRYPSEFSGGQRQRIAIARALAVDPQLVIADEPVSALDVSIQAQILNLLKVLRKDHNLTILFITHDLSVVRHISDRICVMYLGKVVELGETEDVFNQRLHPYTDILLRSAPSLDPRNRAKKALIEGNPPSPIDLPPGCRFNPRCPYATEECRTTEPELKDVGNKHWVACYHYQDHSNVKLTL